MYRLQDRHSHCSDYSIALKNQYNKSYYLELTRVSEATTPKNEIFKARSRLYLMLVSALMVLIPVWQRQ